MYIDLDNYQFLHLIGKKKKKKNWTTKFLVYIIKVTMTAGKNPFAIKYYDGNQ